MMVRFVSMSIVLVIALAAFGLQAAWAFDDTSDAATRAQLSKAAALADAHERAVVLPLATTGPTDHVDRMKADLPSALVAVEVDSGWSVDWMSVALGAAIGAAILLAALLMTRTIERHPPRGVPPLAHR